MSTNKNAFEYSLKSVGAFNYLVEPLFKYFQAENMAYCRVLKNGKRIYLSTSEEWIKLYRDHSFQDDEKHSHWYAPKSDIKYSLWSGFEENEIISACSSIGHYHGFSFHDYNREEGYFEYFSLSSTAEDFSFPNRVWKDLSILHKQIDALKRNSQFLFDHKNEKKLITPRLFITSEEQVKGDEGKKG